MHFTEKFKETKIVSDKISYKMIHLKVDVDPTAKLQKIAKMTRMTRMTREGFGPNWDFNKKYNIGL